MKRIRHAVEVAVAALFTLPLALLARLGIRSRAVTIIGWWGSETVGDIAILGQLLADCRDLAPTRRLRIVSFDPTVTRASLQELGRPDVRVVPVGPRSAFALLHSHAVVVGGGPLMDSPSVRVWAWRVRLARITGARIVLYAVGIGPVRTAAATAAIRDILAVARHIALRDRASLQWAAQSLRHREAVICVDPAWSYVRTLRDPALARRPDTLALALRLPSPPYLGGAPRDEGPARFLATVAAVLNRLARERGLRFEASVMHEGFAESDDRKLYADLQSRLADPTWLSVAPGRHSVSQVVQSIATAAAALTVRFHGFVIAAATDTPVVAVDYATPHGKVTAAAELLGRADSVLRWDELDEGRLFQALTRALDSPRVPPASLDLGETARRTMLASALA